MTETILTAAGIPYKHGRFLNPPAETYAIIFDSQEADGPDPVTPLASAGIPRIIHHDVMVELYEPRSDPAAEAAIEAELDARGLPWTKEARYWLPNVQRYQVVYGFNYTDKRRT